MKSFIPFRERSFNLLVLFSLLFFLQTVQAKQILLSDPGDARSGSNKQVIKVVVVKHFPPHYFLNEKGLPQGFAIDVIEKIAKNANIDISYIVKDSWAETAKTLEAGQADIIPNLGITQSRKNKFDFTLPVEIYPISIILRAETNDIKNKNDLSGKLIGVVKYNIGVKLVKDIPGVNPVVYEKPENALLGLLAGQVDAVVYPKSVMLKVARESRLIDRIKIVDKPLKEIKRAIAVHKGNKALLTKLNETIKEFLLSEEYENIYTKWYGKAEPFWNIKKVILFSCVIIFIIIFISALWRYFTLININKHLIKTIERRDKAEASLRFSEAQLSTLIKSLPDLVWLKDKAGIYLACNSKFERLYGNKEADILGRSDYDFVDKDTADFFRINDKAAMAAGKPSMNEEQLTYADDGHKEIVETIKTPVFESSGKLIGVLGIARDITDRKLAEQELNESKLLLENVLNSTPDLLFVKNTKLQLILANNSYANVVGKPLKEMYGFSDNENGWDKDLIKGKPGKNIRGFETDDREALTGQAIHNPKVYINVKGSPRIFDMQKLPLIDSTGNIIGVLGVARDITEHHKLEEQVRHTQKMDALGKLTGGIAHDYNNMLGVILGYTELLGSALGEQPKIVDYVNQIERAGQRGVKLTKKLLSFSSTNISEARKFNINALLADNQLMLEKTLTARIKLKLELGEDLWFCWINGSEFEDAILNMSINAMHAIAGNGHLTIQTSNKHLNIDEAKRMDLASGDYVLVQVIDSGSGIDDELKEKIFDPFFTSKGDEGTGLGLSQVYGFVERSGGNINVYSDQGNGACFTLYFPRYYEDSIDTENSVTQRAINLCGTESILVIDDEPALVKLTSEILKNEGYVVHSAETGEQALDILQKEPIDLLISDVIMPEMDGYQLSSRAQKKYPDMKIQLVSGYSEHHNSSIVDERLVNNILCKPFQAKMLLTRVRELLDS